MAKLEGDRLIAETKITRYLLDAEHAIGRSKAVFFAQFGFSSENPSILIGALLPHPDANDVVNCEAGEFGFKSTVECSIRSPDGRPCMRSIWLLEHGSEVHRFVTAYPITPRE